MRVLPSTHNSPETAFVINDYPFGFKLRCFKRIWIETATKGTKKGLQRIVEQTTSRSVNHIKDEYDTAPIDKPYLWNKPKTSVYGMLKVMILNDDQIEFDGLGEMVWGDQVETFNKKYSGQLDAEQMQRATLGLKKAA